MKVTDDMLRQAVGQIAEREYEEQFRERTGARKEHLFSLKFYWKMHRMFRKAEKASVKEKTVLPRCYPAHMKRRTAILVMLTAMLATGTVLAAEPVFYWLYDQYIRQSHDHIEVTDRGGEEVQDEEFEIYRPTYVPEGYELISEEYDENFMKNQLNFKNNNEKILSLKQFRKEDYNMSISSVGEKMEKIQAGRWKGYFVLDGSMSSLLLSDGNYTILISSWESREEMMKIAENLEK